MIHRYEAKSFVDRPQQDRQTDRRIDRQTNRQRYAAGGQTQANRHRCDAQSLVDGQQTAGRTGLASL